MNYQAKPGRSRKAAIPPGAEPLVARIEALGHKATFPSGVVGGGVEVTRVHVYAPGNSCFRRPIGRLEEVQALSETALAALIASKFPAPGGAQ